MSRGKVIIITAPSGAGKTTLVKHLLETLPGLIFSVSATSRPMRPGEINGKDYFFISEDEFRKRIAEDAFVEYEEVYPGKFYGTLKQDVNKKLAEGFHVVFDVDVKGALNIRNLFKDSSLAIFIQPPSLEVLSQRLTLRQTESSQTLEERMERARFELKQAHLFDKIIVNNDLEKAKKEIVDIVQEYIQS